MHYTAFRQAECEWEWHIVEGTALAEHCTSWCNVLNPGLSTDGTTEYLDRLAAIDRRIFLHRSEAWHGKIAMVNEALRFLNDECALLEIDSDELWTSSQLEQLSNLLNDGRHNCAQFACRYFLGPDIAITKRGQFGNRDGEWLRLWRYSPGMRFKTHEPPVMDGMTPKIMPVTTTMQYDLVFDHMAYATLEQVEFKAAFYGSEQNPLGKLYADSVAGWKRLQDNAKWPVKVREYLPFVNDDCEAIRV